MLHQSFGVAVDLAVGRRGFEVIIPAYLEPVWESIPLNHGKRMTLNILDSQARGLGPEAMKIRITQHSITDTLIPSFHR